MAVGRAGRWCRVGMVAALLVVSGNARADGSERARRNVIAADETHGMPAGFHAERQTRWSTICVGATMVLAGGLALNYGLQQEFGSRSGGADDEGSSDVNMAGPFFIIAGTGVLLVGIPLLTYGITSPRDVYVRDKPQSVSLRLAPGPRSLGANLSVNF